MKIKNMLLISTLMLCLIFSSCEKTVRPDTPEKAAWLMKLAISDGDYIRFNELFGQGRKNKVSEEKYNEMKKIITAGSSFTSYQLLTFENGEMLLVRLTPEKVNGEYKIEDAVIIPSEMKELFK